MDESVDEKVIKQESEEFARKYDGRFRYEEWLNDRKERMLKVVLTFKIG